MEKLGTKVSTSIQTDILLRHLCILHSVTTHFFLSAQSAHYYPGRSKTAPNFKKL